MERSVSVSMTAKSWLTTTAAMPALVEQRRAAGRARRRRPTRRARWSARRGARPAGRWRAPWRSAPADACRRRTSTGSSMRVSGTSTRSSRSAARSRIRGRSATRRRSAARRCCRRRTPSGRGPRPGPGRRRPSCRCAARAGRPVDAWRMSVRPPSTEAQPDAPGGRPLVADQAAQHGGLAGPALADQAERLAGGDVEGHVPRGDDRARSRLTAVPCWPGPDRVGAAGAVRPCRLGRPSASRWAVGDASGADRATVDRSSSRTRGD